MTKTKHLTANKKKRALNFKQYVINIQRSEDIKGKGNPTLINIPGGYSALV